jgi:hypothetical protein
MLFANRVSCATMRANQVRLCLATAAYIVMRALREFGLGPAAALLPGDAGAPPPLATADTAPAGAVAGTPVEPTALAPAGLRAAELAGGEAPAAGIAGATAAVGVMTPAAAGQPARRRVGQAQCDTLRVRLLKIGAVVRVSVRRVYVSLSEAYPLRELFVQVWENLRRLRRPGVAAGAGTG